MTSQRTRERLVARLREKGIRDERVLDVMLQVPRHLFVDEALASRAYEDCSLPIGNGQTLSQPYMVARMTEIIVAQNPRKVLEIGTGSGYQTAVLAKLVGEILSIERVAPLLTRARQRKCRRPCWGSLPRMGPWCCQWDSRGRNGWWLSGARVTAIRERNSTPCRSFRCWVGPGADGSTDAHSLGFPPGSVTCGSFAA